MRIIDRYITSSIATIFIAMILVFCFLYVLVDVFSQMEDFIEKQVALNTIIHYYLSFLPIILTNTSPMAALIATLFTYSQLNGNNEIIALRASGMNFWKLTRPALCFALIVSAMMFLINERFVPKSTIVSQEIRNTQIKASVEDKNKNAKASIKNLTFYGLKNRLYFIDDFNPNTYEITGVTIVGQDTNQNIKEKIVAFKGIWTGIAWKFFQVQITSYDSMKPNVPGEIKTFPEKLMDIKETPQDFLKQRTEVSAMNLRQLNNYIQRFSTSGASRAINNLEVDFHQKIAFPFGNLAIVLLGLPFALMTGRRKAVTFTSIGIAMTIGFLFYVFNAVGLALGKGGAIPPILAAWMAPVIFFAAAGIFIKTKF
ncbi:MAG: LptF/LptG family permease [Candidatus Omnitrophica bacterium]|nr:LptF/LptG family permease [Candidatus Omnitrophota bacterium]